MKTERKIRVLIVEDTMVGQGLLKGILAGSQDFEVAGIVNNGQQAVDFVSRYHPDVVSMDIYMPVMDGVEATRQIMHKTPVPIVIVSSFYNTSEVKMSFSILEAGALTILPRPFGPGHPQYAQTARNYRNVLKMMSAVKVAPRHAHPVSVPGISAWSFAAPKNVVVPDNQGSGGNHFSQVKIIAIGASAGGPQAIQVILSGLPKEFPVPVLIVQHIDRHFAEGFCDWLNTTSKLPVHIACNGDLLQPGHVYLPPGDHHLGLQREGIIAVSSNPPEKGLRPAVSILFKSVNAIYGKNSICILLSGMGSDGAAELKKLRENGAMTIAQDADSALVHGMPGEAIRLGGAARILSAEEIVQEVVTIANS